MPRAAHLTARFIALLFAACATIAQAQIEEAASASTPANAPPSQKLSATDQQFIQDAGTAGATEIAASKLALTRSGDKDVKEFAQRMIADHAKLARNLDVIAKRHGITSPPSADSSVTGSLQNLKGPTSTRPILRKSRSPRIRRRSSCSRRRAKKATMPR